MPGMRTAVAQLLGRRDVVEHEQPALLGVVEPVQGALGALLRRQLLDLLSELAGERGEIRDAAVLRADPCDDVVGVAVLLDVARGELALADAAEPRDRRA